ncbi:hypothetical protein SAMN05216330_10290 [Bradyrhizobium sp. Ghvi]|uniref:hypothetical protein n=1 Tax=Bradyrhizobium sp. Ghvi TaxID=1855319 RepID=UPI0008F04BEA|nr:hypothetical protein [Bradyrhizobium sp. Ghvi]SFO17625.1 hypothetical protein SAMN05216330_10290 [Bradyrhizobium sp. Ghvi]
MSWDDHQLKLTRDARLLSASPDQVFSELRDISKEIRTSLLMSGSDGIEPLLIERGQPLINLGLACYCTDKSVFVALYNHGRGAPADKADEIYRRGLLLGCLSNATIQKAHLIFDFPRELIGDDEFEHILGESEYGLAETLVRNPAVSDKLLEQLYKREGAFASVPDQRLATLVHCSRENERLNTNDDDDYSPDLGHFRIHNAILQLVETAPVSPLWRTVLFDLLNNLNPLHVARTERLQDILQRWVSLDIRDRSDEERTGLFAENVSMTDEFRCVIASLYGTALKDNEMRAASKSNDVAMRAAYYGNSKLTVKEMRTSFERDGSAFVLAAIRNRSILFGRDQRQAFEEEMLSRDFSFQYGKIIDMLRKEYPYVEPYKQR